MQDGPALHQLYQSAGQSHQGAFGGEDEEEDDREEGTGTKVDPVTPSHYSRDLHKSHSACHAP